MDPVDMNFSITIEIIRGGYVLHFPEQLKGEADNWTMQREIFVSPRKLHQKIKEVVDTVGLVRDDKV